MFDSGEKSFLFQFGSADVKASGTKCKFRCRQFSIQYVETRYFFVMFHSLNNNNNVHLSCAHQRPERSHDTY